MKKEEASYKIKEAIAQQMGYALKDLEDSEGKTIKREDSFKDDLNLDSLDKIEVMRLIEEELKISIEIDVYEYVLTVGDLEDMVMAKLA